MLELTPRLRRDTALAWLDQVHPGDYVTVTTTDGAAVTGTVDDADETGIRLYDHDDIEETHHEDDWQARAEQIYSASHAAPPDLWDMAWTRWPWNRMRHLRPARGRTASRHVREHLREVLAATGGRCKAHTRPLREGF